MRHHIQLKTNTPKVDKFLTNDGRPGRAKIRLERVLGDQMELNTMPGWAGSSWYFTLWTLKQKKLAAEEKLNYWKQVDLANWSRACSWTSFVF